VSFEVPEHIGELSTWAFEEALGKIDAALADAPDDVRAAISVIRLVSGMPRQAPWYGVHMPTPEGDTVSMGTVLGNAFEAVGDWPWAEPRKTEHWFTRRHYPAWRQGRRDYHDYLDHLFDPGGWETRHITAEQAAEYRRDVARYLREKWIP
jgi:hypothetical protein